MADHLMQFTLFADGTIIFTGSTPDDLGEVLRMLADAADAGRITWSGPVN